MENLLQISGTHDKLMPPKSKNAILIEKGKYLMIVDRASEISKIINERLKQPGFKLTNSTT